MKRYKVEKRDNEIKITDVKTGVTKIFDKRNFVVGTMYYRENTAKYPNYVHMQIWF